MAPDEFGGDFDAPDIQATMAAPILLKGGMGLAMTSPRRSPSSTTALNRQRHGLPSAKLGGQP